MKSKPTDFLLHTLLLIVFCLAAACRRQEPLPPSPEEIVASAAARLAETAGFHFVIEHSGAPVALDPDGVLTFRRAEGDFVAPDRARASARIAAPGLVTDVDVISVAERQWQTNPLTRRWEELPPDWGFNPAVLFDNQVGLPAILVNDLSELMLAGMEQLEGRPEAELYAISGRATGERLSQMSGGLIGPDPVGIQLWIVPETFELVRAIVTETVVTETVVTETAAEVDETSVWQVEFSAFGQTVEIAPPATE